MPTPFTEIVERLFLKMEELVPAASYPAHVLPIRERIAGTAFFPGGSGLYLESLDPSEVESPVGGVMILGHNFDSESGFRASLQRKKEILSRGAWAGTLMRLNDVRIPLNQCFFTNAFMGLCEGNDNKKYLGRECGRFREACASFLKAQIELQKPRLIVTLGLKVPPLLATIASGLEPWEGKCKRHGCDPELKTTSINHHPKLNARFEFGTGQEHRAVIVPITHPGEGRNLKHRHPLGYSPGLGGEIELMREGWIGVSPS